MLAKFSPLPIAVSAGSILLFIQNGDEKFLGIAVIAAIIAGAFIGVDHFTSKPVKAATMETTPKGDGGVVNTGGGHIEHSNVAGRDQTINYAPLSQPALPERWWLEENAPKFDIRPNAHNPETGPTLLLTFEQTGADVEVADVRWIGEEILRTGHRSPVTIR